MNYALKRGDLARSARILIFLKGVKTMKLRRTASILLFSLLVTNSIFASQDQSLCREQIGDVVLKMQFGESSKKFIRSLTEVDNQESIEAAIKSAASGQLRSFLESTLVEASKSQQNLAQFWGESLIKIFEKSPILMRNWKALQQAEKTMGSPWTFMSNGGKSYWFRISNKQNIGPAQVVLDLVARADAVEEMKISVRYDREYSPSIKIGVSSLLNDFESSVIKSRDKTISQQLAVGQPRVIDMASRRPQIIRNLSVQPEEQGVDIPVVSLPAMLSSNGGTLMPFRRKLSNDMRVVHFASDASPLSIQKALKNSLTIVKTLQPK